MTARDAPRRGGRIVLLGGLAVLAVLVLIATVVVVLRPSPEGPASAPGPAGRSLPPPPGPSASSAGPVPAGVTIAAVGDLACDGVPGADDDGDGEGGRQCQQRPVSDLLVARRPAAFLALGDLQYDDGTLAAFRRQYGPTFGRLLAVTRPAPGNHEYHTPRAAGYYAYFGARAGSPRQGYYSFDLGGWHAVALNSNCGEVSCAEGSPQERWLRADLAAHPAACTLAFWHHPRWSHGRHGDNAKVAPLVQALADAKAELLLTGHDHNYERFTPRSASGEADPDGVREFVVGTGGRSLRSAEQGEGTEALETSSFGALFLTLSPTGYRWEFDSVNGPGFSDTGSATCH